MSETSLSLSLLLLLLLSTPAAALVLTHRYPDARDHNTIELSCDRGLETLTGATFLLSRGGTEREREIAGEAVPGSPGTVLVTITPETEGGIKCMYGGSTSSSVPFAAQPSEWYNCADNAENRLDYRLVPFVENDRYHFNCTIRPGATKNSYSLEWRSRVGASVFPHSDWDPTTFELRLSARNFPPFYREMKWLECRVEIEHAPGVKATYCGRALRVAVGAAITTPLPLNTMIQANHPGNLTCTAVGSELQFNWYYGNKHFIPSDDCRNGICVHLISSPDDPLIVTSVLSLSGVETVAGSQTETRCVVWQNVTRGFGSRNLTSRGIVTVVGVRGVIDTTSPTSPPSDQITPTEATPTTSIVGPNHVTIIIISIPTTTIVLLVLVTVIVLALIFCHYRNKNRKAASPANDVIDGGETGDNDKEEEEESSLTHSVTVRLIDSLLGAPPTATPDRPSSEVLLMTRQPTFHQFLRSILPSNSRRFDKFMTIFLLSSPPSREHLRYVAVSLPEREIYSRTRWLDGREERKMASVRECLVVDTETGWRNKVCSARPLPSNRMIEAPPTYQPNPAVVMATDQQNLPENGSEYQTDTTVPLETTGDQIEPLETTGDQKEPLETTEDQSEPLETAGDQNEPLETTEDQNEPLETTEDQGEPLETTEDQSEPLETTGDQNKPLETTGDQNEPLETTEDQSEPLETTEDQIETTGDQNEPLETTEDQSEPLETTEDQKEPLETTEDQKEPLETTEDQKEPLETTGDQKEPLETRIRPNDTTTDNSFQHLPELDHSGPLETTVVARDATPDQHEPHTNTHHNSIAHAPLAE